MNNPQQTLPTEPPIWFQGCKGKSALIVGAGWSGLYASKWLIEEGFNDVVVFEKTNSLGGIWVYRKDIPGGCFLKTRTTASKSYLHASDLAFSQTTGHFPNHEEVLEFLKEYAKKFKLEQYIRYKHHVHEVRKEGEKWKVTFYTGAEEDQDPLKEGKEEVQYFDFILSCSGQHQNPYTPDHAPWGDYKGEVMHAHEYKHPTPDMEGKTVVVVGGGESASDVAAEVCEVAKKTLMSIRQGVWFQDRTVGAHQPADMVFTKHQRLWGFTDYHSWLILLGRYIMLELMWGKGGSGVDVWQPKCQYFHGFLNKSRDVVDKVALGKVFPRGGAERAEGNKIWFRGNDEPDEIDLVIFATGYRANVDYLDGEQSYERSYKLVFDPFDPTLCYIGSPRPMIGSIPALAELQARWVAKVYAGKVSIPGLKTMQAVMKQDHIDHKRIFPQDDRSLPQLVNHWAYSDEIADMFGAKPKLVKWFFRNPFRWWRIISAPWSAFLYRVEDEDPRSVEEAFKGIELTWLPTHFSFHAMNNVVLFMDFCVVVIVLAFIYYFFSLIGIF